LPLLYLNMPSDNETERQIERPSIFPRRCGIGGTQFHIRNWRREGLLGRHGSGSVRGDRLLAFLEPNAEVRDVEFGPLSTA